MAYVFGNQYGVVTVRDAATLNKPKEIRFITPEYRELFKIPDGGQILLCYKDGTVKPRACKYIDDYHLLVGSNAYHICEFAERTRASSISVVPFPEKRVIWSNIDLDTTYELWKGLHEECYPDLDIDYFCDVKVPEVNDEYLCDERENLDLQCGSDIIVFGDIGRWNGRAEGYKIIESGNIRDCLYTECDMAEWYVDREGEFRSRQIHHDGTNYLYYRKFKSGLSYDDREDFLEKFYDGKATQDDVDRVTEKLGKSIGEVYGWKFPTEQKERVSTRDTR